MRIWNGPASSVAVLLGIAATMSAPAGAQSMGEVARQERAKRAKAAKPAKVYTDADLLAKHSSRPADQAPVAEPSSTTGKAPAATAAKPAEDEAAERKKLEADWRIRFADAHRKIAEAELRCWHSVVRTVFVAGVPVQQWVKEFEESEELRQAKKDLVDLEEEFRKTGLPPGWTRQ
jgi:hypothetical protein